MAGGGHGASIVVALALVVVVGRVRPLDRFQGLHSLGGLCRINALDRVDRFVSLSLFHRLVGIGLRRAVGPVEAFSDVVPIQQGRVAAGLSVTGHEAVLAGSRLNRVVRVGDTVHRPTGAWTPTVHGLLRHLRDRGFTLGPQPLGFDEQGREVLSYLDGETVGDSFPWPDWVWAENLLAAVGRATAAYHEAVADFRPAGPISWHAGPGSLGPDEIVCHHDIAPYNVVVEAGRLRAIIDWDLVGPGTRRSELAFVAWQWVPLQHPSITRLFGWRTEPDLGRRLRILLDSYGLSDRSGFVDDVMARIRRNRDLMLRKCHEGDAAYMQLQEEGHVIGMNMAIEFVGDQRQHLQAELD